MFQIGEYVVYGCKGIHQILDMTHLSLDGVSKDRLYYVMQPVTKKESAVYAPVDAANVNMRPVMTKDAAEAFLHSVSSLSVLDAKSPKQREECYKSCIRSCDPTELMQVIKTLRIRKEERKQNGKKLTVSDMHYLEQAEGILYEELKLSLGMDENSLLETLRQEMRKTDTALV